MVIFHSMLAAYAVLVPTLMETARQDCIGFGNVAWLTESFTCLSSVRLEV